MASGFDSHWGKAWQVPTHTALFFIMNFQIAVIFAILIGAVLLLLLVLLGIWFITKSVSLFVFVPRQEFGNLSKQWDSPLFDRQRMPQGTRGHQEPEFNWAIQFF